MQSQVKRWPTVVGLIMGLVIWVYDYDFFLNAGGPARPISTAILKISHLEYSNVLVLVLWPLCVLMCLGAAVGFLISRLRI